MPVTTSMQLPCGRVMQIDEPDLPVLDGWKLSSDKRRNTFYVRARRRDGGRLVQVYVHVLIAGDGSVLVDHRNGNGLDNRRDNLRVCNNSQNGGNIKARRSKSGFKGVHWQAQNKKWFATICCNRVSRYLGTFEKKEDAAQAYNEAAVRFFGEFADLNVINSEAMPCR